MSNNTELMLFIILFAIVLFILFLITSIIITFLCKIFINANKKYVDKTWQGWSVECYKFNVKNEYNAFFIIFSGLHDTLTDFDGLDLEAELEDNSIIPLSSKSFNEKPYPIIFLLDRNNGNRYIYRKFAKIKFELLSK